ncbi:hypothetical protein [Streptomyces sp. NPDC046909]|uniref:hypothetical protein n=1 Tax=Streptomyces sp. NPDC046909 TaxID=3155617 RepID=UPI0033EC9408
MTASATVSENGLRTMLARRSGIEADALWSTVYDVPRVFGVSWPLTGREAEEVLSGLLDTLRRVLPAPLPDRDTAHGLRYVYLSEITDRYAGCGTRRILERIHYAGITPAGPAFDGGEYDPRCDADADDTSSWARAVRAAGPRPRYRMPDPYVGEGEPPVDRALGLRESTGDLAAYRTALLAAVREDPRQVDCWAHLGIDALERADDEAVLAEALGYYQTGVAVAELALPPAFTGVLAWGELDNRPFLRALHGLGLTWWRLGENAKAAAVFGNSLFTNPDDNQGIRTLIGQVQAGAPWHPGP